MPVAAPDREVSQPTPPPRLLVELPSRPRVFLGNLAELVTSHRSPAPDLFSAPADFWPDVFVKRRLPWGGFAQSCAYHAVAFGVLVAFTRLFAMHPRVVPLPEFEHSEVLYYSPSEYLPPLDTRIESPSQPQKADPELSRQPIISVPAEADNHEQTIVTPPRIRLKRNVALPNIVAWSDTQKPHLEIPAAPVTPASDLTRMAPQLENSVVAPAPDAARLAQHRPSRTLESSVVAPPPELQASNSPAAFAGLQPALIAPPPSVENATTRSLGDLNIGQSPVIAPAPQLPVAEQSTAPGGRAARGMALQVVPPPPSASAAGLAGASVGSRGQVIALNLHPAVGAPPEPPPGNRRGNFAATPEGHAGASGNPGSASASASHSGGNANGSAKNSTLPAGLYVGNAAAKSSPVPGELAKSSVNPNLIASARPPRVAATHTMQPESAAKLTEAERTVFGNRRFYSVSLNMPNLNSAGGSWIIRFAELNHEGNPRDAAAPAADLSQPMATRKVDPAYPVQLMRENVAGTVILYAVIHADGTVGNVRVLRGVDERLDRYASEALAQWKFDPATKNGSPVDVEATFQIPFKPAKVGTNF